MGKINNKITCGIFSLTAVAGLTYLGTYYYYKDEIEFGKKNSQLFEVIDNIDENFYLDVDKEQMTYDMISGAVNGLDDKFSYYRTLNQSTERDVNSSITLQSSGFQIDKDVTGNILVTEVEKNSQAEKMGLKADDLITDIDGENVIENGYYNIISELMGKDYTKMNLKIMRDSESFEIEFVRRNIMEKYSNVDYRMLDDNTLYYRFNSFDDSSVSNFRSAINENPDTENIIFDLRKNGGGLTTETIKFFDLFADSGNQIKEVYSKSGKEEIYETSDGIEYSFNVVLLVSGETYSSGEIFPLLFQDTGLGTVIGTQTAGKGVFQLKYMLENFTSLYLVGGYYYVNDCPNYNNTGITPDIEIPMDNSLIGTDDDIQLKKAIEILEK
ncbi:MAG: S41 family peptidase [Oscillospiraceae bacterium]|nr:S41 family peptidase [Oscillospiraceae bacterium]